MSQILLVGASVGLAFATGGASAALQVGIASGLALAQQALAPDQVVKRDGARLNESQINTSVEGQPLPRITSKMRLGGQIMWATTFRERVVTTRQSGGGKGGGPKQVTTTTEYLYSTSFAVALCEGDEGVTLTRVWADGKILDLSKVTYRFYNGSETQTPDPKISAVEGEGTVPAFRGTAYIVFEDMDIGDYGNRIPQITCELNRLSNFDDPTRMENTLEAVNIIPGSGEFIYGTRSYFSNDDEGNTRAENTFGSSGDVDFVASLDRLNTLLPNVSSASLVVSWFGSSLDATVCKVEPKVDTAVKTVSPQAWQVSDRTRGTAEVVSLFGGKPAFGGTPSDISVREAVIEMKDRGLRVMFYPFLLMDVTDYPWRGAIAGDPTDFLGTVGPSDFTAWDGTQVAYSGPGAEWSHRRMILHYATLLSDLLKAGDAFLIGSEFETLSRDQAAWGTGLASLMTDVRTVLGAGRLVSYAANWSEYDEANLDPVWTSADFVGIDNYLPLTDWRTAADEDYTIEAFTAGVNSGEYWDYFYADETARLANTRTPIANPQDRQKDIRYWRDTNFPAKPVWFTEFGCPAIDKGANQPNVFPDAKAGSELPWFSNGTRNDTVQRLYIEATIDYWSDDGLVDPANMFVWTWDARPYPSFPANSAQWADAANWQTGHWITGRVALTNLADIVIEQFERVGVARERVDTSGINGITARVRGLNVSDMVSPRVVLTNLMETYLFDIVEDGSIFKAVSRANPDLFEIDPDDMVLTSGTETYKKTKVIDTDLPDRVKIDFLDEFRDFQQASVDGHTITGKSRRIDSFSSICVLDTDYARALADIMVQQRWIARDGISFTLPFGSESSGKQYLSVLPGDIFEFQGKRYRVAQVSVGDDIAIEAVGHSTSIYTLVDHATSLPANDSTVAFGSSLVLFADLPLRSETQPDPWSPRIVGRQNPWPGEIFVYRSDGSGGFTLETSVTVQAVIGETTTDLGYGAPWIWDDANTVTVRLYDPNENLSSLSDLSVLNGANAMAVLTPSGDWEIFQFANATLNGDGTYTLSRLLRGQVGTDAVIGDPTPVGSRVILYETGRFFTLPGTTAQLGLSIDLRYGPSGVLVSDDRYQDVNIVPRGVAYRPYAPTDLQQHLSGSDLVLSWIRRTRFGGDTWEVVEVPLNEDYERYEVDILDGAAVVRTVVVDNATTLTYTEAQQIADFGSSQGSVSWVVYQMSATYGRGSPANG